MTRQDVVILTGKLNRRITLDMIAWYEKEES